MEEKRSESKYVFGGIVLTAAEVLGIDVQVLLAQFQTDNPELLDLMSLIKEGSPGGWQTIAVMWLGIGAYTYFRTKLKLKG